MVLCRGEAERNERVLPEARRSTPGKIHLLAGPQHGQTKLKLVKKGNTLRRRKEHTVVFFSWTLAFIMLLLLLICLPTALSVLGDVVPSPCCATGMHL